MRKFLLASAGVAIMGGAAYAAEPLEPIAPPPPPTVVEPFVVPAWAGPYVGADIGWGWAEGNDDHHFFDDDFDFFDHDHNGLFDDDDDLDGLVGGVFAGWLGQRGTFLYGVELFGQIADLDRDHDDDHRFQHRDFDNLFDPDGTDFGTANGQCFFDANSDNVFTAGEQVDCPGGVFARGDVKVHALFGLEGMIGWGGERTAFLLHAGPALGWFQADNGHNGFRGVDSGDPEFDALFNNNVIFDSGDDDEIELGVSLAAEGRFKLTERVFAGVIGRAFWFPDVGDDDNGVFNNNNNNNGVFHDDDDDVTVFEVKARLGVIFGQPPAAAPVEAAY